MQERVLVLGGTGFIGANVVRALLDRDAEVTVLSRNGVHGPALAGVEKRVRVRPGNLWDKQSLRKAMRDHPWVVHAAGHYPVGGLDLRGTLRRGVTEMRNVLAAAREERVQRVVYTSSLSTIGRPLDPERAADERDHYLPGSVPSAYFEVKWAMEQEAMRAALDGQDVVVVNPTISIGPWDPKPTSGQLVTLVARKQLPVYVEGELNFVHVRDVARGHVAALEKGKSGERYVLGGENVRAGDFFRLVAKEAGVPPPLMDVGFRTVKAASVATEVVSLAGHRLGRRLKPFAPGVAKRMSRAPLLPLEGVDVFHYAQPVNPAKMTRDLGIAPTPLAEAVRDALEWFRAHGYLDGPAHSTR